MAALPLPWDRSRCQPIARYCHVPCFPNSNRPRHDGISALLDFPSLSPLLKHYRAEGDPHNGASEEWKVLCGFNKATNEAP
jgi:hypothetical protein